MAVLVVRGVVAPRGASAAPAPAARPGLPRLCDKADYTQACNV